ERATPPDARPPPRSRERPDAPREAPTQRQPALPVRDARGGWLRRLRTNDGPDRGPDTAPPCSECPAPSPWYASAGMSARSAPARGAQTGRLATVRSKTAGARATARRRSAG